MVYGWDRARLWCSSSHLWATVTDGRLWGRGIGKTSYDLRQLAEGFPLHCKLAFQLPEELTGPWSAP